MTQTARSAAAATTKRFRHTSHFIGGTVQKKKNSVTHEMAERLIARTTFHNGVGEHSTPTDGWALAVPASERHHSFVFVYYVLYLSHSHFTHRTAARSLLLMCAHAPMFCSTTTKTTISRRKCRCIEEEEIGEALTRYLQQLCSLPRQACGAAQEKVRFFCSIRSKL